MSDLETVRYERRGAVALLALNRPQASNSFNARMRADLLAAVERADRDAAVCAAVLTGEGRNFSAGHDLTEPPAIPVERLIESEYQPPLLAISRSPKPWIAAVNGAAAGIGSSFAMACDLMVMADDAFLYQAFVAIGLIPDGGATWQLVRQLGRRRAFEMIVDGEKMSAERCVALGLANRAVPAGELLGSALGWAEALSRKAPLALRYSKEALYAALERNLEETIGYEARLQSVTATSEDATEGARAFLEKRAPVFRGR